MLILSQKSYLCFRVCVFKLAALQNGILFYIQQFLQFLHVLNWDTFPFIIYFMSNTSETLRVIRLPILWSSRTKVLHDTKRIFRNLIIKGYYLYNVGEAWMSVGQACKRNTSNVVSAVSVIPFCRVSQMKAPWMTWVDLNKTNIGFSVINNTYTTILHRFVSPTLK